MAKLDTILHQELRLSIVSFLINIESADFKKLLEVTSATKGNLSVQISKLQDAGYIEVKKSFKGKYPHTQCKVTNKGTKAFKVYVSDLKKLLKM
jgi:DNA-binding transcriptional ArsR family regulator